jgi:glycosyltransferase involved in cell wall biosynthesis
MNPVRLSAVIITLNEEKNIGRCLDSLIGIADEIVVVDSFSTDATEAICLSRGARFLQHKFEGHIQQQNYAKEQAAHDYIISIDADEELSSHLKNAILEVKKNWQSDGYVVNRLTSYCGKWIRHCGWYPDKNVRIWNRKKGKWGGENPHNKILIDSPQVGRLHGDLLHYSFPTIASHLKTINNFSEIAALAGARRRKKIYFLVHILGNPVFTFTKKYFFQLGFLDGYYGFVICVNSAFANFTKYAKLHELQRKS